MKTTLSLILFLILSNAFAGTNYYSPEFIANINKHLQKDDQLKMVLFTKLSSKQNVLGYDGARKILFGRMFIKNDGNGNYITDVYCHKKFDVNAGVNKNTIPDGNKINCEHTWPQSRFTGAFPNEMQKSDLHHLFPTDSHANSTRGNDTFTEVSRDSGQLDADCSISKFGSSTTGRDNGFEPPLEQKGNVARALFYFSVRYKIAISKNEEDVLRRWNDLDPVDQEEMDQNNIIEEVQGNRNPFIDFQGLANDISNF